MVRSVGKSGVFKSAPTGVILGWDVQSNAVNKMHTPNRDFWPFRLHKTQKDVFEHTIEGWRADVSVGWELGCGGHDARIARSRLDVPKVKI